MASDFSTELAFAKHLAVSAGNIALAHRDRPTGVKQKADDSWVSDVDLQCSERIGKALSKRFPQYAILDEEQADSGSRFEKEYCWVVDPLDSSKSFIRGEPDFGVLMGLLHHGKPVMGVTYRPAFGELAFAVQGQGAFMQARGEEKRLQVADTDEVYAIVSRYRDGSDAKKLVDAVGPSRLNKQNGALKTVEVARGSSTVFLCPAKSYMHLWDLCAPSVILEEAGGKITDLYGKPFDYTAKDTKNYNGVVATNGIVHSRVLSAIEPIVIRKVA